MGLTVSVILMPWSRSLAIPGIWARLSPPRKSCAMANPGEMTSALLRDPRRWAITIGGVVVYGLGSRLWLPGINPEAVKGLAVPVPPADLSIFGVGARPMLFGLALAEMARLAVPPLARWVAVSQNHSERLWRAARIFALALAAVQGMEIAKTIEGLGDIAPSPGSMFRLGVVVSIVGATAFLILLARIMTERGIGDGMLVLLAAPVAAHLPNDIAYGVEIVRTGLAPHMGAAGVSRAGCCGRRPSRRFDQNCRQRWRSRYLAPVARDDRPPDA